MNNDRKINVLVVDDEAAARNGLVKMVKSLSEVAKVDSCANGIEAINFLNKFNVDLLLLDIQMPLVDGFDVIRSVKPENIPYVVFVTAFEEYAVKAFEFHAIDYVLKPFSDERLFEVVDRVKHLIHDREHMERLSKLLSEVQPDSKSVEYIDTGDKEKMIFKENGVIIFLNNEDIQWIEAFDYYVKIHVKGKFHLVRTSLKKLTSSLDPQMFVRIHKSAIVNTSAIAKIETRSGEWFVDLNSSQSLKVGRVYKDDLKRILKI